MSDGNIQGNSFASSIAASNLFGSKPNINDLIRAVLIGRSELLDENLFMHINDMNKRNEWLESANSALGALRTNRPNNNSDVNDYGTVKMPDGTTMSVKDWMDSQGISIENDKEDNKGTQRQFDAAIDNMKSSIDTANSVSQLEITRFQGIMDKRNQNSDTTSNVISKTSKAMDNVVSNLR